MPGLWAANPTNLLTKHSRVDLPAVVGSATYPFRSSFGRGFDSHRPLQITGKFKLNRLPLHTRLSHIGLFCVGFCIQIAPKLVLMEVVRWQIAGSRWTEFRLDSRFGGRPFAM